jgi:uncharacterized protein (TIGR00297 family)
VRRWLLAAGLGSSVAATAYWRRALTLDGALAAALVGCIVFARGGLPAAGALLAFFGSSSVLSRTAPSRKQGASVAQVKGARRDAWQVLANGGFATLSIMLGRQRGGGGFLGALSAAGADTWATELGMLLARRNPRLITTLRPVPPGISGGITPEGLAASLGGGLSIGLAWSCLGGGWRGVPLAVFTGICGSLIDSLLGATVQALYQCPECEVPTEERLHRRCGQPTELVRGKSWATNDTINALSTFAGAAIGMACWVAAERCFIESQAPAGRAPAGVRSSRLAQRRAEGRSARRVG